MKSKLNLISLAFLVFLFLSQGSTLPQAQEQTIRPALLEQPMPDFSLPSYQGQMVRLADFKGKNIMLIFPRGFAAPERWCTICHYKYVELVELEKAEQIRKKI